MEGKGNALDENLQVTLCIAALDGNVVAEFPTSAFVKAAGLGDSLFVTPEGWLDDQTLLVGAYQLGKDGKAAIIHLNVVTGELALFTNGAFVGFVYP